MGDIGDEDARFLDNKKIEGTIPQMLDGAMSFVQRNMRVKTILNANGKREDKAEYPMKAVREILLNALIHRDYSMHTENSPIYRTDPKARNRIISHRAWQTGLRRHRFS